MADWQPIETAPKDGTLVDLKQGPIINLGCVWDSFGMKKPRWVSREGDYLPTIEPREWRISVLPAPPEVG